MSCTNRQDDEMGFCRSLQKNRLTIGFEMNVCVFNFQAYANVDGVGFVVVQLIIRWEIVDGQKCVFQGEYLEWN